MTTYNHSQIEKYIKLAKKVSENSLAERLKVGAIIVDSEDNVVSVGFNQLPPNHCMLNEPMENDRLNETYAYVLHAEEEAIRVFIKEKHLYKAPFTIYLTHSPCINCAKLIYISGIENVFFEEAYRNTSGISFLLKEGIRIKQFHYPL